MRTFDQCPSQRCEDILFLPFALAKFPFEISQFVLQKLQCDSVCRPLDLASEVRNDVVQRGQMIRIHFELLCIHQFSSYIQSQVD